MSLSKNELVQLLNNTPDSTKTQALDALCEQYPFCQTFFALRNKANATPENTTAAAIRTANRGVLFQYIQNIAWVQSPKASSQKDQTQWQTDDLDVLEKLGTTKASSENILSSMDFLDFDKPERKAEETQQPLESEKDFSANISDEKSSETQSASETEFAEPNFFADLKTDLEEKSEETPIPEANFFAEIKTDLEEKSEETPIPEANFFSELKTNLEEKTEETAIPETNFFADIKTDLEEKTEETAIPETNFFADIKTNLEEKTEETPIPEANFFAEIKTDLEEKTEETPIPEANFFAEIKTDLEEKTEETAIPETNFFADIKTDLEEKSEPKEGNFFDQVTENQEISHHFTVSNPESLEISANPSTFAEEVQKAENQVDTEKSFFDSLDNLSSLEAETITEEESDFEKKIEEYHTHKQELIEHKQELRAFEQENTSQQTGKSFFDSLDSTTEPIEQYEDIRSFFDESFEQFLAERNAESEALQERNLPPLDDTTFWDTIRLEQMEQLLTDRSLSREYQNRIIERFIKSEPSIHIDQKRVQQEENVDLADQRLNAAKLVVSERLADIYAKQGKKARAIEIYKELANRNPEKNAYFAEKIERLK